MLCCLLVGIMSNQMNKFIILFLVIIFYGCSKSLDIQLEPEVSVYLSKESKKSFRITQKNEAYTKLNQWLVNNKANWYATSGRYPGGVYVKSGNFGIQITKTKVIIYSTANKDIKAIYAQELKSGELNSILNYSE